MRTRMKPRVAGLVRREITDRGQKTEDRRRRTEVGIAKRQKIWSCLRSSASVSGKINLCVLGPFALVGKTF